MIIFVKTYTYQCDVLDHLDIEETRLALEGKIL